LGANYKATAVTIFSVMVQGMCKCKFSLSAIQIRLFRREYSVRSRETSEMQQTACNMLAPVCWFVCVCLARCLTVLHDRPLVRHSIKINYNDFKVHWTARPKLDTSLKVAHNSRLYLALKPELEGAEKCCLMRGNGEKRCFRQITSVLRRAVFEAVNVATGRARYISHSTSQSRSHHSPKSFLPHAPCQSFWMKRAFTNL
jgi:hypothetical protein